MPAITQRRRVLNPFDDEEYIKEDYHLRPELAMPAVGPYKKSFPLVSWIPTDRRSVVGVEEENHK